jgi:hypothetical protein
MLPIRQALTSAPPTGGICGRVLRAVGTFLIGSALHRVSLPVSLFKRASSSPRLVSPTTMASANFCPDRSRQICLAALALRAACGGLCPLRSHSPGKNAVLRHTTTPFTSRTETNGFAVLCQLTRPDRPSMGFLFIGSWLSHSLPSDVRSPSRPWPLLVLLIFIVSHTRDLNPTRTTPMLGTHKPARSTRSPSAVD